MEDKSRLNKVTRLEGRWRKVDTRSVVTNEIDTIAVLFNVEKRDLENWQRIWGRIKVLSTGIPWWCSGWESACQCRGHGFVPWTGRIPHAAEWLGL